MVRRPGSPIVRARDIESDQVDRGLIGVNPCRRLRVNTGDQDERPHAVAGADDGAAVCSPADSALADTAAYTGRSGAPAGLTGVTTYGVDDHIKIVYSRCALTQQNGPSVKIADGPSDLRL